MKLDFSNTTTKKLNSLGFLLLLISLTNTYSKPKKLHTEEIKNPYNVHIILQYYL